MLQQVDQKLCRAEFLHILLQPYKLHLQIISLDVPLRKAVVLQFSLYHAASSISISRKYLVQKGAAFSP
jgi:hypothetical protein